MRRPVRPTAGSGDATGGRRRHRRARPWGPRPRRSIHRARASPPPDRRDEPSARRPAPRGCRVRRRAAVGSRRRCSNAVR
ncbi:MAG: hypothetical protein FGM58_07320 [Acidimicrobiia bacterium]|nr:hypothetical protein [Acidimicrobiia bacterium]